MLPPATQSCHQNRIDVTDRCEPTATEFDLLGKKEGACKVGPVALKKIALGSMEANIKNHKDPRAQMSPAYDFYKNFEFTELHMSGILSELSKTNIDQGSDLRFLTCNWVVNNMDHIFNLIPKSHPRTFVETSGMTGFAIAAVTLSVAALLIVLFTMLLVIYRKRQAAKKSSQIEFLVLLLAGLFMVALASLLMALNPSSGTCITSVWLITIGYTLELVPLLFKVSAIIKLIQAAKKLKRVAINRRKLIARSLILSTTAAIYCLIWTVVDPPQAHEELHLSDDSTNEFGETVVSSSKYCDSEMSFWYFVSFGWQGLLLIGATVLAHQMRSVPHQVNDSKQLAVLIYSSFVFLILRAVVWTIAVTITNNSLTNMTLQVVRSILCSLDTIVSIAVYFPKVLGNTETSTLLRKSNQSTMTSNVESMTSNAESRPGKEKDEEEVNGEEIEDAIDDIVKLRNENKALLERNDELQMIIDRHTFL